MDKYKWNNENYEGEPLKPLPPQYKFQQLPSEDNFQVKQSEQPSINKFPDMTPPEKQFVDQKPKPKLSFWESIFCWFGKCQELLILNNSLCLCSDKEREKFR